MCFHPAILTTRCCQPTSFARLKFLRSNLFIAIVSLFVLTGYAFVVLDYGCDGAKQEQVGHSKTSSGKSASAKNDDCQCLCHQIFTAHAVEPLRVAPAILTPADFVAHRDEFPPDAVPLGIDYPPQFA